MKITKDTLTRDIKDSRWPEYQAAGWKSAAVEQAGEEIICLKPPVKPKATEIVLDLANNNLEGDE
jgi:hypothetical protein